MFWIALRLAMPGRKRYAFKGKTADGRSLTAFVGKDVWEKAKAQMKK